MLKTAEDGHDAACRERWLVRARKSSTFALVFAIVLMVAGICAESSFAARGHEFAGAFGWGVLDGKGELQRCTKGTGCQTGLSGSGPGQLNSPAGVAVNETTGDVYVVDKANNSVEIFNASGTKFEGEFNGSGLGIGTLGSGLLLNEGKAAGSGGLPEEVPTGRFDEPEGIAVDNDPSSASYGDVYVVDIRGYHRINEETPPREPGPQVVDKFSASGEYIGQITRNPDGEEFSEKGFRYIDGVAVDPRGDVWVEEQNYGEAPAGAANYTNAVINAWIGFRSTDHFQGYNVSTYSADSGLAVNAEDNLYVHNDAGPNGNAIVEFSPVDEVINPGLDDETPTGVAVELSSGNAYVSHASNVHRLDGSGVSLETLRVPGAPSFTGVAVNSLTLTVYAVDSADHVVDVFLPEAAGHPTVESGSETVDNVTSNSAIFSAKINPRSEPNEGTTSYSFEYGPCETAATCSSSPYTQSVPVPDGVLAANYEPDLVSGQPQDLSAHTVYHMRVVAHNSHPGVGEGEELVFTTQSTGAFSLPDARAWELVSPADKYGALIQAFLNVSQASPAGDAITYHANAPIEAQPPGNYGSVVQALSGRTATGWQSVDINAAHETTPGAGGTLEYPFFSTDLSSGVLQPAGAFVSSLSSEASEQTPYLRTDFAAGDPGHFCTSSCYTPLVSGAPGFENVPSGTVFGNAQFGGGECTSGVCGPQFVGASPDASHIILQHAWAPLVEGAPTGSLYEWAGGHLSVVSILPNESPAVRSTLGTRGTVRNAVSADGYRVVWSDGTHLYLRDSAKEKTVLLDEVQGGTGAGGPGEPAFQTASSDGSRVFFIDSQRLTKDATASFDLYECQIVEEAGELKCKLTDLTGGGSESAGVKGPIPGASEDGSYVYFIASGALTGTQANERGETAVAGQSNLYVRHAGVTRLIAVLSSEDSTDWAELRKLTARVSPNGAWFSFMSQRPLTGFDNRDAISGKHDQEVFLYHAGENGEGKLVCASCDPTGGRPHGVVYSSSLEGLGPGGALFTGKGVAGMVPGWTSPFYQSRYLSNSGRLFFDSFDALVPQDTNSAEDAYQFEPSGVGGCTEASTTFVVASNGCVGLISSGTSQEGSAFLDASESGGDVFFLTVAQLSPLDNDSAIDIYDAHECGAGEDCSPVVPAPVPACEGDACQSPVAPPEDPTPGSLTYQGPGNPPMPVLSAKTKPKSKTVKCKRGAVKQHGKCVKKAKAKKAKAKRSTRRGK